MQIICLQENFFKLSQNEHVLFYVKHFYKSYLKIFLSICKI